MKHALVLLLLLTLPAMAGGPQWACAQPKHDFGTMESIGTAAHDFVIRNTGDRPLQITRLIVCCGMTANVDARTLPPGGETTCHVTLSLITHSGAIGKALYIVTNAAAPPVCRLEMAGTVIPVLDVQPPNILFGASGKGGAPSAAAETSSAPREQVVTLHWKKGGAFAVTRAASNSDRITVTAEAVDAATWRLTVRTVPPLPPGMTSATVTVTTNRPECPPVTIPVLAAGPGSASAAPPPTSGAAVPPPAPAGSLPPPAAAPAPAPAPAPAGIRPQA